MGLVDRLTRRVFLLRSFVRIISSETKPMQVLLKKSITITVQLLTGTQVPVCNNYALTAYGCSLQNCKNQNPIKP